MEYFDVYDKHGKKQNKTVKRGTVLKPGEYVLIIHLWIQNTRGEFLIQKRAKEDDRKPYQWAITTGIAMTGETALTAVIREADEELGIKLTPNQLQEIDKFASKRNHFQTLTTMYLVKQDIDLSTLVLNPEEVSEVAWKSLDAIQSMIEDDTFWNYPFLMNVPDYFRRLEKSL